GRAPCAPHSSHLERGGRSRSRCPRGIRQSRMLHNLGTWCEGSMSSFPPCLLLLSHGGMPPVASAERRITHRTGKAVGSRLFFVLCEHRRKQFCRRRKRRSCARG